MKGKVSKRGTKLSWGLLLLTVTLLIAVSTVAVGAATVTKGVLSVGYFPNDFATAKEHPYTREDYLLEGETGQVIIKFMPQTGTGFINVTASSNAFTTNSSLNSTLTVEDVYYAFKLTFKIKSGIDGRYVVNYQAANQFGDVLDKELTVIEVWSKSHRDAADALYATQDILYYAMYYGDSSLYESPEARSNVTDAVDEFALAELAYRERDWTGTKTHADNTITLLNNAEAAEEEFIELNEEHTNAANNVNLKIIDFLGWMTYPALIIAVLAIVYIVVAILKKIQPQPKPK